MSRIINLANKEWQAYIYSPLGYIFAGLLLSISSWLFFQDFFVAGVADLSGLWATMGFLFSLFVPAISMNLLAEEKRNNTWEVLLSLPVNEAELVVGKFLGSWFYLVSVIGLALPAVGTVWWLGEPEVGPLIGGLLGTILLGSAYLATGLFGSSLTAQPAVGFLISLVILFINSLTGQEIFLSRLPGKAAEITGFLSLNWHTLRLSAGLITLSDVVFYMSWIVLFLAAAVIVLKSRDK